MQTPHIYSWFPEALSAPVAPRNKQMTANVDRQTATAQTLAKRLVR